MSIEKDAAGNVTVGVPAAPGTADAPLPYGLEDTPQFDVGGVRTEWLTAPAWLAVFTLGEDKPTMYRKEG